MEKKQRKKEKGNCLYHAHPQLVFLAVYTFEEETHRFFMLF
jgi:CRISPR/Cas system CSM-associated protein Csm4 (group 5 of RAMP superfamily)